jgi:signal recognition particle subunit SRP19
LRKKDRIVVWPAYFDSTKTRSEGRRIPKNIAVPSPEIVELSEAVKRLGLDYEVSLEACYPKTPWRKTGVLLLFKNEKKCPTIAKIARSLLKVRKEMGRK